MGEKKRIIDEAFNQLVDELFEDVQGPDWNLQELGKSLEPDGRMKFFFYLRKVGENETSR
jgi:tRNA A58 N-methylase Trm61